MLPLSDLPEVIDREEALSRGHIARLKNEEPDHHSVIFQNNDGTKSLYMFASPVKYTASDGTVRDKRTEITRNRSGFAVNDNDVQVSFGSTAKIGVSVTYGSDTVTIKANDISDTSRVFLQDDTVIYNNALGTKSLVYYTPLLSGVENTVVLKEYDGTNSFSFSLTSNNLNPNVSPDGVINLVNSDNDTVFKLGTFVVTDANGKYIENTLQLSQNKDGYVVTAMVDKDFLESEDTEYPVRVAANLVLNTSSAIDDAVIYQGYPNTAFGAYQFNNIGYLDDNYKIGIFNTDTNDESKNISIQKTIVHEIGHLYRVADHYDPEKPLLDGQSDDCIWGINKGDYEIMSNFVMCEYCTNVLNNNLNKFNHQ